MGTLVKQARFVKFTAFSLFLVLGGMGAKCDGMDFENDVTLAQTSCKSGQAQISVYDGKMQNHCGCQESAQQFLNDLTCTVSVGTTVFFHFNAAFLQHQIVPVGTPALPQMPIYIPNQEPPVTTHGFVLNGTAGDTFEFRDQFDPTITGQFILVP